MNVHAYFIYRSLREKQIARSLTYPCKDKPVAESEGGKLPNECLSGSALDNSGMQLASEH